MLARLLVAVAAVAAVVAVDARAPDRAAGEPASVPIAIVGDSIIAGNVGYILPILDARGVAARAVDALSSRKTSIAWFVGRRLVSSGIDGVRSLRARGVEPELWVIELGTNDTYDITMCRCPDRVAFAGQRIDALRAELGPDARVLWVNVRTSSTGALAYNEALARRVGPHFVVADWKAYSAGRSNWFVDAVHPTATGARELAGFLASAILSMPPPPSPLPDRCSHDARRSPSESAVLSGHVIAAAAARRCQFG